MDDIELAKALLARLSKKQLEELTDFISTLRDTGNQTTASLAPPPLPASSPSSKSVPKLRIEFCESNAASFGQAFAIARRAPDYSTHEEHKKTWHVASWPEVRLDECMPLALSLGGLRNKRCIIDGQERDWAEIFGFVSCAADRKRAYRPDSYCFGRDGRNLNPWGCVHARMDWTEWARWFTYGRFEQRGFLAGGSLIWIFDKKQIRHELENNIFAYRFCPHLNTNLIEAVLSAIPDHIDVEKSADWTYHECYDAAPGRPKIIRKEKHEDYVITNEFYADGVKPVGVNGFRELIRKAFSNANLPHTLLSEVCA